MALFLWSSGISSTLPIMTTMDEAPPNSPSLVRRSFFQAVTKCEMRSWKSLLSILISAILTDERANKRDGDRRGDELDAFGETRKK